MEGNLHLERQRCEIRQNHSTLWYFREVSQSGVSHGPWQTMGIGDRKMGAGAECSRMDHELLAASFHWGRECLLVTDLSMRLSGLDASKNCLNIDRCGRVCQKDIDFEQIREV